MLEIFKYPVTVCSLLDNIEFAYSYERQQYNSTMILEKLSDLAPDDSLKIIAVCEKDLFIPILTYVFGEAQLRGRSCIVSTYRLSDSMAMLNPESIFTDRVIKETVHELGHTFNIRHCPDKECVMHYCRSLNDVDNKDIRMCRYCNAMLEDEKRRIEKRIKDYQIGIKGQG
jgi:archaemetzincin